MRRRTRSARPPKAKRQTAPGSWRDRLAVLLALVTTVCLGLGFLLSKDTQVPQFLMPGPLASAHAAIENCNACHTKSGSDKSSWIHSLVARDPLADSKACLTCHKMPDTAFNAHSASAEVLTQSTKRLTKIAAETPVPLSAGAQSVAFPTHDVVAGGLYCATCHQEHKGVNFNLSKISNEQCQSCHVVKFDSFDGYHPEFENYPFSRRSRIIYDHPGHALKHFPDVAKRGPARHIPAIPPTCSTCHNSRADRRVMAVAPFEQICTTCHLDQITGKERVSGPKGIAFLTLPGLDLQTLKNKNAWIGEWPEGSEAELTSFMKVMISRSERGRALIKTVDRLNLQDLSDASDDQIKAVTDLAWEIKRLFYALIRGKASDVLADLNIGGGVELSANLVADLSASIPRDVVIGAQQQWLPNLGTEMASRQHTASIAKPGRLAQANRQTLTKSATGAVAAKAATAHPEGAAGKPPTPNAKPDGAKKTLSAETSSSALTESRLDGSGSPEKRFGSDTHQVTPSLSPKALGSKTASKAKLKGCVVIVFSYCLLSKELPSAMQAGLKKAKKATQPEGAARKPATANAKPDGDAPKAASNAVDNALPDADAVPADVASKADANAPADAAADSDTAAAEPHAKAAPLISIESNVDPESWADYGGWYRQDYAIFYRPTGHKDRFIYSWLVLTGPQAPKGDTSPAAAVFDFLTSKDAQGACTKCHSVDAIQGKGRVVNFSPSSVGSKQGRFTNFIHEPHFGILENRGCLTCHNIERSNPYLQSYEHGNPKIFASNFGAVNKELCQTCHTSGMARQDCLLCHKYHVSGVITPIMSTRVPAPDP